MSTSVSNHSRRETTGRLVAPGLMLGIGLGGFVDGILLHQILQWHHMLSSEGSHPVTTLAGLEANTLADGLFHAATWVATAAGAWLLWRRGGTAARGTGAQLAGLVLAGWGTFDLVEGTVDHHILGLHHVKAGAHQAAFDLGFLALGAVLLVGGLVLARRVERSSALRSALVAEDLSSP